MLSVQEKRSSGKYREEDGRQEKEDLLTDEEGERTWQITAGVFPGAPPWKQMLSRWKSFLKKTTWLTQRLQFEQVSPSHQRLPCPIEGMILARPHQQLVNMDEPGLGGKGIPPYPRCYNTHNLCAFLKEGKLSRWIVGAGFSLFKDNKEIQCFLCTWVVDWDLYPLHSLVLIMISCIVEFFGYFTYVLFSKVYYVFDYRDHLKITVILLPCAWNITLCKYPCAAQSLQNSGFHLVCWA